MLSSELSTYLGIALEQPDDLVQARARVCSQLGLLPRSEAHVTLAHLGRLESAELDELCAGLLPSLDDALVSLQVVGVGAAYEPADGVVALVQPGRLQDALPHACVAWWAVAPSPALTTLRDAAIGLLARLGKPVDPTQPFCPHVTLGSRGRPGIAAADFDLFTVAKASTLAGFARVDEVRSSRIHIAASNLLPASVVCLRAW